MSDGWVVIPNWDKFQYRFDRPNVAWIKQYTDLVHRDEYLELTPTARALLHGIWTLYALSNGVLRADSVQGALRMRASSQHWESLNHAGFIDFLGAKPAPLRARAERRGRERPSPTPSAEAEGDQNFSNDLKPARRKLSTKELRQYTGCRRTRGTHGAGYVHDPLGMDNPPNDWPYPKPDREEVELHLEIQDR